MDRRYDLYKHTLFHWETLLVITTSDTEDVALPFISEMISWDFLQGKSLDEVILLTVVTYLSHTFVIEMFDLLFVINFEDLLAPSGRV